MSLGPSSCTVSETAERVRRERRSILIRPRSSMVFLSNWVMSTPLAEGCRGVTLVKGSPLTTKPPRWVPICRGKALMAAQ